MVLITSIIKGVEMRKFYDNRENIQYEKYINYIYKHKSGSAQIVL